MQNVLLFIGVVVFIATAPTLPPGRSESVLVRAVASGGTIDVSKFGRVRLIGIQVPAPFANAARERLAGLLLNRWVRLESDVRDNRDNRSGATRALRTAYVITEDGVCANTVLVREGLARVSAKADLTRLDELQQAEAEAKRLEKGMWGYTRPPVSPPQSSAPAERSKTSKKRKA